MYSGRTRCLWLVATAITVHRASWLQSLGISKLIQMAIKDIVCRIWALQPENGQGTPYLQGFQCQLCSLGQLIKLIQCFKIIAESQLLYQPQRYSKPSKKKPFFSCRQSFFFSTDSVPHQFCQQNLTHSFPPPHHPFVTTFPSHNYGLELHWTGESTDYQTLENLSLCFNFDYMWDYSD